MARGCRGQQGHREQVEGGKTTDAGREVETGEMKACLARQSKTRTREENRLQRTVQISIKVSDGRGNHYTKSEGDISRKQLNGGTGFKTRR